MAVDRETTEVRETDVPARGANVRRQTVRRTEISGAVVFQRVVYYITGVIIALLALRMLLQLLAANNDAGFVTFIYNLSAIFAQPFFGIFSYEPSYGKSVFELSTLVAIVVYALIGWGIAYLATLNRPQDEI